MDMTANPPIPIPSPARQPSTYSLAFWCLVFFTFIVFVAPQNIYAVLQPLHLARLSIVLAMGVYVLQALARRESLLPAGPEVRLLAVFILLSIASIPFSIWRGGSIETLTDLFAKSVLVFLLAAQLLTTLPLFRRMLWFTMLYCIIDAGVAIVQYQQGQLMEGYRTRGAYAGINSNPNDLALTLNLVIPFGLALYSFHRGILRKGVCLLFLLAALVAIMLAYSRGGFITLAAVLVLCVWKMAGRGRWLKFMVPAVLLVAAFAILAPPDYDERLQAITDFSKDKVGSGQARWDNALRTLEVIAEHPLLGVGLGMNILALNEKGTFWSQVHNVYLQIASEIGVPGVIVFVLLLLRLLKGVRQIQAQYRGHARHQELVLLATATEISLLAYCIAGLFHPVAYHFYFYYIAGFALALQGIAGRLADAPPVAGVPPRPPLRRAGGPAPGGGTREGEHDRCTQVLAVRQ